MQAADREDIEQEAVVACWPALGDFDPNRASLATYIECVVASRIASACRAHRRRRSDRPLAFASDHRATQVFDHRGLRIDVKRLLSVCTDGERSLASLLMEHTPSEAGRMLRVARSTIYERIHRLRRRFAAAGFGAKGHALTGRVAESGTQREPALPVPTTI